MKNKVLTIKHPKKTIFPNGKTIINTKTKIETEYPDADVEISIKIENNLDEFKGGIPVGVLRNGTGLIQTMKMSTEFKCPCCDFALKLKFKHEMPY